MKSFNYYQPTDIRFGCGRINEVGKIVSGLGKNCLMVTVPEFAAMAPLFNRIKKLLAEEGVEVFHFDGVVPNPTTDSIDMGTDMAIKCHADVILGVGCGSSMDTAKAIAVGATHEGSAWDYRLFSGRTITEKRLPIVVATTTAGTGSQVTPVSVLTNTAEKCKFALADKLLCPKVSIVDPELTLTVPAHVTASTGFDVFAHAFESYIHRDASEYTDMHALEAMKKVVDYLPEVLRDGSNLKCRTEMAWADTLGGLCIANAGTTLPHGIGMAIGGHAPSVMHGEGLAAVYPEFLTFTREQCVAKFASVARIFDGALENENDETASKKLRECIVSFLKQIDMLHTLKELKVPESELSGIADDSVNLPDYTVNPRVATRDEIYNLLTECYDRLR